MARAIALRSDFTGPDLHRQARSNKDASQARRLLALAMIYDGGTRSEAAPLGSVTLQIVRDWVVGLNAEGPERLRDRKSADPTPLLTDAHRAALLEIIDRDPIPAIHGVVGWRLRDLGQWLFDAFQVSVSPQTLSRTLRGMGLRKLSARPKHPAQAATNRPTTAAPTACRTRHTAHRRMQPEAHDVGGRPAVKPRPIG